MTTPTDRKYTKEHEWLKVKGNTATIGITDHAQHALTDIVFVELPTVGKKAEAGKAFCVIESVKSVSDVFSPVTGEVTEVNSDVESSPELINQSPYENGWLAKLKVDKVDEDGLMTAEEYDRFVAESH